MNIKWDADAYSRKFSFVADYGRDLISLIDYRDGMRCLDLGCGNGRLTQVLAESGMKVLGMDSSLEQLQSARVNYPDLEFAYGDAVHFALHEPVDVVFSNAVFHWIGEADQHEMLKCVHGALVPGGQFVFEMGGDGNNALIHKALRRAFTGRGMKYQMPFYFPSIAVYTQLMEQAGLKTVYAVLFDRMTELSGENGMRDWIQMFVKAPFEGVNAAEAEEIINEASESLRDSLFYDGKWHADYVRLRCKAIRGE